jgi:hypothetical protein
MAFITNKPEYNPLRKENSKMNIRRLVLDVDKAIARMPLSGIHKGFKYYVDSC